MCFLNMIIDLFMIPLDMLIIDHFINKSHFLIQIK